MINRPKQQEKVVVPREHDFSVDRETWELAVFDGAGYFTVVTYLGVGRGYDRAEYQTFPEALDAARQKTRPMVYAVCPTGRFTHLEVAKWDALLERWQERHSLT